MPPEQRRDRELQIDHGWTDSAWNLANATLFSDRADTTDPEIAVAIGRADAVCASRRGAHEAIHDANGVAGVDRVVAGLYLIAVT